MKCVSCFRGHTFLMLFGVGGSYKSAKESHPAIIDKDIWEAVQFEMKRRKIFAKKHGLYKHDYATDNNPFAGKVICGCCGSTFGRKVWNSTDERLKRTIWQCNNKYTVKGKIGCGNRHINDGILYEAFVYAFNEIVKNIDYYMTKWQKQIDSEDILEKLLQDLLRFLKKLSLQNSLMRDYILNSLRRSLFVRME